MDTTGRKALLKEVERLGGKSAAKTLQETLVKEFDSTIAKTLKETFGNAAFKDVEKYISKKAYNKLPKETRKALKKGVKNSAARKGTTSVIDGAESAGVKGAESAVKKEAGSAAAKRAEGVEEVIDNPIVDSLDDNFALEQQRHDQLLEKNKGKTAGEASSVDDAVVATKKAEKKAMANRTGSASNSIKAKAKLKEY